MNKVTTVNIWLNNFTDVGLCDGHFNFERQRKFNYLYRNLNSVQVKEIDGLHLWEGKARKTLSWSFSSFCEKLKELGFLGKKQ